MESRSFFFRGSDDFLKLNDVKRKHPFYGTGGKKHGHNYVAYISHILRSWIHELLVSRNMYFLKKEIETAQKDYKNEWIKGMDKYTPPNISYWYSPLKSNGWKTSRSL